MYFKPEILLVSKGYEYSIKDKDSQVDVINSLTYLEIPILLAAKSKKGMFFQFGVFTAFKLSAKQEHNNNGIITERNMTDFNSMDAGFVVGAGWEKKRFSLDARYDFGLMDISGEDQDAIRTRTFLIMIGMKF